MSDIYHDGEREVQKRAGGKEMAGQVAKGIRNFIPDVAKQFLQEQELVVLSSISKDGKVWASPLFGEKGFMRPITDQIIEIDQLPATDDPLMENLQTNSQCGMIAIEFSSRRRMRVNGDIQIKLNKLMMETKEVYANCPKYIQARECIQTGQSATQVQTYETFTAQQTSFIENADTFFIASAHPNRGADASHRGGHPGFIQVEDGQSLVFPDYSGNNMFNTLGNLYVNPRAGLLFIDFLTGETLQLTGKADILWDSDRMDQFPGAKRLIRFNMERLIERKPDKPSRWNFIDYSPFLP